MPKRVVLLDRRRGRSREKDRSKHPLRSLIALAVVLGITIFVLDFTSGFYYDPICRRYADSRQLKFRSSKMAYPKHDSPAECFFDDRNGNIKRIEVASIPLASADWVRRGISWLAMIGGVGGSVFLGGLIGGFKPGRRRKHSSD
jgi:hypothetical protein